MVDRPPKVAWVELEQGGFRFCGRVGRGADELQLVRDSKDVRVDSDAFDDSECLVEHYVRGFPSHAGELLQFVDIPRDLPTVH